MAQEPVIQIWPGSGSFESGKTAFGYFDGDSSFILDADKVAVWCARRMGYPITDIELIDENFYAAFEEAVIQYGSLINSYNARDNLISLLGQPTGSQIQSQFIPSTLTGVFQVAEQYATPMAAGGNQTYYTGSINIIANQQVYDLDLPGVVNLEQGDFTTDTFTIRRIFHDDYSPLARYLDPIGYSGVGNYELLNQFGWGNMGIQYTMMPLHYDLLRMQGLEMHQQIRKSAYSFQLTKNRIRIFPVPTSDSVIYFHYTLDEDIMNATASGSGTGKISDYSNIPYGNINYSEINDIGKNWIRRYTLSLSKETLGLIRGKYNTIPIPGNEITLNGDDLVTSARTEMEALVTELKEVLDSMSKQAQLERKAAETEAIIPQLRAVPSKIYVK
jgi:hypothetical protein